MAFLPAPFNSDAFDECIDLLCKVNKSNSIEVHNISSIDMNSISKKINYDATYAADGKDYLYDASCSKNLTGSRYKKIRYYIKRCEKDYNPKIEKYDPSMYNECFKLTKDWIKRKLEKDDTVLYKEHTKGILKELWMFDDMFGIVARVKGELVAFSLGGILLENGNTGTCIIRKTADGMKGLSEFIDWNFYNPLPGNIKMVNDGDDCLSQSLAAYKMKWRPARVQPIFKARIIDKQ